MLLSDLRTPATIASVVRDASLPVGALSKSKTPPTAATALVERSATLVTRSFVPILTPASCDITFPTLFVKDVPTLSPTNPVASNTCVLDAKSAMTTAATEIS